MWKMKMTPGMVKPQYLSFYLTKIVNQGQFWNPRNEHISKLTFLFEFGEDLRELLSKNKLYTFSGFGTGSPLGDFLDKIGLHKVS